LAIEQAAEAVLAANPSEVARFKAGEVKLLGFLVGQAMKNMLGKGNPKELNRIISDKLSDR